MDKVQIGEYVDINVPYDNVADFDNFGTVTEKALIGWRVIDKEGAGKTGTVKLVSEGCPLKYYHNQKYVPESISELADLYTTIELNGGKDTGSGFVENGFSSGDLQSVFNGGKNIDKTKGVHALSCSSTFEIGEGTKATEYSPLNEVEKLYTEITGENKSMRDLYSNCLDNDSLLSKEDSRWNNKYTDLLWNGQIYYFGGASYDNYRLWVLVDTVLSKEGDQQEGIRPVVSLEPGVKIDSTNPGTGVDSVNAYQITK